MNIIIFIKKVLSKIGSWFLRLSRKYPKHNLEYTVNDPNHYFKTQVGEEVYKFPEVKEGEIVVFVKSFDPDAFNRHKLLFMKKILQRITTWKPTEMDYIKFGCINKGGVDVISWEGVEIGEVRYKLLNLERPMMCEYFFTPYYED